MAYFTSAARRPTLESSPSMPMRNGTLGEPRKEAGDVETAISAQYERWSQVVESLEDRDGELVRAWADQADGLVTFAALFSAVITSFIIQSSMALKPDSQMLAVVLLNEIVAGLHGATLPSIDISTHFAPFKPALSDVLQNSALLASLICSLLAAGMGIFYKEWLREYVRGMPTNPRMRVRVREHRHQGLLKWRMQAIISGISLFLQLGVALFIAAIVLFAWPLHPVVRLTLGIFVVIWVAFWIGTAFCPLITNNCPFRSPLSRLIYLVSTAGWNSGRIALHRLFSLKQKPHLLPVTLEAQEMEEVSRRAGYLEASALRYAYEARRDDPLLANWIHALRLCQPPGLSHTHHNPAATPSVN
ncbi:hypothetical protein C8Q77DRAFT_1153197 [Trametes polyzona]|nr:hypothetical protein C8Q77DRAFT_1153197 [Trametes polyzona]